MSEALRKYLPLSASCLLAIFLLAGCLTPQQDLVKTELNADRVDHKLKSLSTQIDAQQKAQAWAEKLASEKALYHSNLPDGIKVKWCSIGENVGRGPKVADIEDAYMASEKHRTNILNTKWNGVGVGYAVNGTAIYTVQVFIKTC